MADLERTPVAWRWRKKAGMHGNPEPGRWTVTTILSFSSDTEDWYEIQPLYTHPSDPSAMSIVPFLSVRREFTLSNFMTVSIERGSHGMPEVTLWNEAGDPIATDEHREAVPVSSDPSATERMRATLRPFDVTGIPEWGDDENVYLSCDGEDLGFIPLKYFRQLAAIRAALGEA